MASIRSLIAKGNSNRYDSRSHELMVEQNGHLETLAELAQAKAELMKDRITASLTAIVAGADTNRSVPITDILDTIGLTRAYTSADDNKIKEQVAQTLASFIESDDEHITATVTELITRSVRKLFNDDQQQASTQQYLLAVENNNFIRLDLHAWKMMVNTNLNHSVAQVGAFVLVKSVVDKSKVDFNTLLFQLQHMISQTGNIALLMKITDKVRAIYDRH